MRVLGREAMDVAVNLKDVVQRIGAVLLLDGGPRYCIGGVDQHSRVREFDAARQFAVGNGRWSEVGWLIGG